MSALSVLSQRLKAAVGMAGAAHSIIEDDDDNTRDDARWTLEEAVKSLRQIDEELEIAALRERTRDDPEKVDVNHDAQSSGSTLLQISASLRDLVEAERRKIFKAMGILDCIMATQDRCSIPESEPDVPYAAEAARDLLDDAAGRLDAICTTFEVQS